MFRINRDNILSKEFKKSLKKLNYLEIISSYSSFEGPLSLFAKSTLNLKSGISYEAIRLIERKKVNFLNGDLCGGGVLLFQFDSNQRQFIKYIPRAEDPRLFLFNNIAFVYYQIYNPDIGSTDIYFEEIQKTDGKKFRFENSKLFLGKNWSPFEYKNELYFIHTYNPFFLIKPEMKKSNNFLNLDFHYSANTEVPNWKWSAETDVGFVTEYRGGTRGIEIDHKYYFFGHRTHKTDQLIHTLFVAKIDFSNNLMKYADINNTKKFNFISDPYGLNYDGINFLIDITLSKGFAGDPTALTELVSLKVSKTEIDKILDENSKQIYVSDLINLKN